MSFVARLTAPTDFSTCYNERRKPVSPQGTETGWQHYYSGDYTYTNTGPHTGNCTWYAMGRSCEIAQQCRNDTSINIYSEFAGPYDAQNWTSITWKGNSAIISGSVTYQPGDILIWSNANRTAGHVEIVEDVDPGDGHLVISYSAYSSMSPQSTYGTFFNVRLRPQPTWGDPASVSGDETTYFVRNSGAKYALTNETLIGVIHNPYYVKPFDVSKFAAMIKRLKARRRRKGGVRFYER